MKGKGVDTDLRLQLQETSHQTVEERNPKGDMREPKEHHQPVKENMVLTHQMRRLRKTLRRIESSLMQEKGSKW